MIRGSFSPPDKLIFDVQGVIVELKREYFTRNSPLNDDETLVHKLCVRLENVLRYGAREKYTFMGVKKDYWNYIVDCIHKDETVKFVQSVNDIKTYQGKGRAFLRQALMEKSLADALQRCAINERMTKEYYVTDSVLRNSQQLQTLIHSLYDLNAVDFQLPHKGYDLDRSFPSFARKTFENKRRSSTTSSYNGEDLLPADPVQILNNNVDNLVHVVTTWLGRNVETPKTSSTPSLQRLIEKVIILGEDVTKIKSQCQNEIESLNQTISKLKEKNVKSDAENQEHINKLNAKFSNIQQFESTATNDKMKNLYDKLVATEFRLTESEAKCSLLSQGAASTKKQLENISEEYETEKSKNKELQVLNENLQAQVSEYKNYGQCHDSTNKILESKLTELQKINDTLTTKEKESSVKLIQKESLLKTKEAELISLQEAFQKSTGLVVGSFKEFKDELNSQLKEKTEVLQTVAGVNETLSHEAMSLSQVKSELEEQLNIFQKKYEYEAKKKEEAQKVISELKLRLTEEKSHQMNLLQFVNDVSKTVLTNNYESVDDVDGADWNLGKNKHNDALKKLSSIDERELTLGRILEIQKELVQLKADRLMAGQHSMKVTQDLKLMTTKFEDLNILYEKQQEANKSLQKNCDELNKEIAILNIEIDKYNGEIFNMSIEITKLNEGMVKSEESNNRASLDLIALQSQYEDAIKLKDELKENNESISHELSVTKQQLEKMCEENVSLKSEFDMKEASEKESSSENEEIKNVLKIKSEEMQSLKFQLSTEEMKKETVLKELSDAKKMQRNLMDQLSEREVKLKTIETEQSEHMITLEIENETLANENTNLRTEYDESKEKCEIAEKEITFLKIEVSKLAKEKEEEKATRINGWNRLNNVIEEKKQIEADYKEKIQQLTEDIDELKAHAMNLTRDKHELWTMKDQLEFELKQKADDRWVDDKEAKNCTNCKGVFSLTLRKHHCRLCGHIFCHNCSNRWLKTAHSKKKVRACGICADTYSETREGSDSVDGNESILSLDQQSVQSESLIDYSKENESLHIDENEDSPADDSFEFLDPAEVSSSGAFGPSEQIRIEPGDVTQTAIVPAVNDQEEDGEFITKEKVSYQITAGQRCVVPVLVGSAKFEITWEFESSPKDIGFGIAFKENEEKDDDSVQTCIPLSRYISHKQIVHGRMKIQQPGIYYFIFNNSYSRLTAKQVTCSFTLLKCK